MSYTFENLNKFFEKIKSLRFWERLFAWRSIRILSYEAYEEFKSLLQGLQQTSEKLQKTEQEVSLMRKDLEQLQALRNDLVYQKEKEEQQNRELNRELIEHKEKIKTLEERISNATHHIATQEKELAIKQKELDIVNNKIEELTKENARLQQEDKNRREEQEKRIAEWNTLQQNFIQEKQKWEAQKQAEIQEKYESMKRTWKNHEMAVEQAIREICRRYTIEYLDKEKLPFKLKPDNTIRICDEFVIFDAKSPANDDLENFPTYIKNQAEQVKKYIKEQNVRKEIFLVIPSNTVHKFSSFVDHHSDYTVYFITLDALEPVILSLKRIEAYEFAQQLSPEDRENICRIIAKFAHLTKRRVQIDYWFSEEFFALLNKCKADLPPEILQAVIEFEKADKLNPPQERRAKPLITKELEQQGERIRQEAEVKGIAFPPELSSIKQIPISPSAE